MQNINRTVDIILSGRFLVLNNDQQNCLLHKCNSLRSGDAQVNWIIIGLDNGVSPVQDQGPSHYLNQCWLIVDWPLERKRRSNFNQNMEISILKRHFKMSSPNWPFSLGLNVGVNNVFRSICQFMSEWIHFNLNFFCLVTGTISPLI